MSEHELSGREQLALPEPVVVEPQDEHNRRLVATVHPPDCR